MLEILLKIVIYFQVKKPLNLWLYSTFSQYILALILALIFSFFISWIVRKILTYFLRNFDFAWNELVIYNLIYPYSRIEYGVFNKGLLLIWYNTPYDTAPMLSWPLLRGLQHRTGRLNREMRMLRSRARVLESISTALDKDRTHHTHGSLHDVFTEQIPLIKREFMLKREELVEIENLVSRGVFLDRNSSLLLFTPTW